LSQPLRIEALSVGYALDAAPDGAGVVHSVFAHAVNLLMRGELWTLLATHKSDLPFGIRVALRSFDGLQLHPGEPVNAGAGLMHFGSRVAIDYRKAPRWSPVVESEIAPGFMPRLAVLAEIARPRSWARSEELAREMKSALNSTAQLGKILPKVVGCGPGATPSGDDVLVGIFAVLHSPLAGDAGVRDATRLRDALRPLLPATTDISAHLLRQAAHGFFSRDLGELRSALAAGTAPRQMSEALRRVLETGATSGADTGEGLLAVAPGYFLPPFEQAAA
jgi:hypothetical protein